MHTNYNLNPSSPMLLQRQDAAFSKLTSPEDVAPYSRFLVAVKTNAFWILKATWNDPVSSGKDPTCFGYFRQDEIFSSAQPRCWRLIVLLDTRRAEDTVTGVTALNANNVLGISMRLATEPEIRRVARAMDDGIAVFRQTDAADVLAEAIVPLKVADYLSGIPLLDPDLTVSTEDEVGPLGVNDAPTEGGGVESVTETEEYKFTSKLGKLLFGSDSDSDSEKSYK